MRREVWHGRWRRRGPRAGPRGCRVGAGGRDRLRGRAGAGVRAGPRIVVAMSDYETDVAVDATGGHRASRGGRFALAKFRPTTLPATLVTRSALHDRLRAGTGQRLTVVVGSAGSGKSVLLSSWAAGRPPGVTSWLSCDAADANPVRFWAAFIEAPRAIAPWFGTDAADLLAMDGVMSADVTASIANDAAKLPPGSALIVDDFHMAAA